MVTMMILVMVTWWSTSAGWKVFASRMAVLTCFAPKATPCPVVHTMCAFACAFVSACARVCVCTCASV
jgi:hypothetical protein